MRNKNFEVIVGMFVVLVLILLGWLTTQMGKFNIKSKPVYTIYAPFDDIAGLDVNTKIKVAGVDIGVIKDIKLENGKAIVTLAIYDKYKIPKDSLALIRSKSMLGDKFLEIKFGHSKQFLSDGDFLTHTESATDVGALINNINKIFNNQQKDIQLAVENARLSMEKLNKTLDNLYFMTYRMKQGKGTIGKFISDDGLYKNLNSTSGNLSDISSKIKNGEGTLGKLVNDDGVYNNLNDTLKYIKKYLTKANRILINVSARTQYGFRDQESKGKIYADIYTMPDKFYRIGITDETDHSEENKKDDDNKMRITALMGKKYYDFTLKGGIIESTFGLGVDYSMLDNKLMFSVDAFDFNHDNDIRDKNAQVRAELAYTLLRHFSVFGGVDEILNSKTRSAYIGAGMEFSNDDLKYFMDKAPTGAFSK